MGLPWSIRSPVMLYAVSSRSLAAEPILDADVVLHVLRETVAEERNESCRLLEIRDRIPLLDEGCEGHQLDLWFYVHKGFFFWCALTNLLLLFFNQRQEHQTNSMIFHKLTHPNFSFLNWCLFLIATKMPLFWPWSSPAGTGSSPSHGRGHRTPRTQWNPPPSSPRWWWSTCSWHRGWARLVRHRLYLCLSKSNPISLTTLSNTKTFRDWGMGIMWCGCFWWLHIPCFTTFFFDSRQTRHHRGMHRGSVVTVQLA